MDPLLQAADDAIAHSQTHRQTPPSNPTGRLWAIGDIHLSFKGNRDALEELQPRPNDGLILCGDVGESVDHCRQAFEARFTVARMAKDYVALYENVLSNNRRQNHFLNPRALRNRRHLPHIGLDTFEENVA